MTRAVADVDAQCDGRSFGVELRSTSSPASGTQIDDARSATPETPYWTEGLTRAATEQPPGWGKTSARDCFAVACAIDGEGHSTNER